MQLIKILLLSLILASCSTKRVAFTSDLQKEYSFTETSLKHIQFYTSEEIILQKSKSNSSVYIAHGEFNIQHNDSRDRIIIKKGTPCVLVSMLGDNALLVSFEQGEDKFLAFGNISGGFYSLSASHWDGKEGKLKYAGNQYTTNSGAAYLTVKVKSLKRQRARERVAKGRRIS
jgi:hypothetical protein